MENSGQHHNTECVIIQTENIPFFSHINGDVKCS